MRVALFTLALIAVVAGCGGSVNRQLGVVHTVVPRATQPLDLPTAAVPPEATAAPIDQAALQSRLSTALLSTADLPAGWSMTGPGGSPADAALCGVERLGGTSLAVAGADFVEPASGTRVSHRIAFYAAGAGIAAMAAVSTALKSCTALTTADDAGAPVQWALAPQPIGRVGDETVAAKLHTPALTPPLDADLVFVRHGDIVSVLVQVASGPAGVDSRRTSDLVRRAAGKILNVVE